MKKVILIFVLLGLLNYCFGQQLPQEQDKKVPLYLLDYDKEDPIDNLLETKELTSDQPNTKVLLDGMVMNSTKHFIQIKQPDVSQLAIMPQVQTDTNTHYHIQIIGEVKKD